MANVVTSWSDLVVALKLNPLTRFDLNILYINIELARDPSVTQVEQVFPATVIKSGNNEFEEKGRRVPSLST